MEMSVIESKGFLLQDVYHLCVPPVSMFELTWVSRVSCFSDFCYRPASDLGLGMYDLSDAKAASDQFKCPPKYWSFLFWTNIYDQQGPSMQY